MRQIEGQYIREIKHECLPIARQLILLLILRDDGICPIEAEHNLDGAAVKFRVRLIILRCFVIAGLLLFSSLFAACVRLSLPNLLAFSCLLKKRQKKKKNKKTVLFSGYCGSEPGRPWHIFQPKLVLFFFVLFWGFCFVFDFFLGSTRTRDVWTSALAF